MVFFMFKNIDGCRYAAFNLLIFEINRKQMEKNTYKSHIKKTISVLEETEMQLHCRILNLAMTGEMKEFDEICGVGEIMTFKMSDFMKLDDDNIKNLIEIYIKVFDEIKRLKNLFPLKEEENDDLPF